MIVYVISAPDIVLNDGINFTVHIVTSVKKGESTQVDPYY